jgi:hypothetical protein
MPANSVAVKTLVTEPISKIVFAAGGDGPAGPAVPDPMIQVCRPRSTPTATPTSRRACRTSSSATSGSTFAGGDGSDRAGFHDSAGAAARRRARPSHHC